MAGQPLPPVNTGGSAPNPPPNSNANGGSAAPPQHRSGDSQIGNAGTSSGQSNNMSQQNLNGIVS